MKSLFSLGIFAASIALSASSVRANDPSVFPVAEIPSASAAEESLSDDLLAQFHGQQASFTSSLAETPTCGPGSCGASRGCDGGASDPFDGCPLLGDEPLLGFLRNQPVGCDWTISLGGELRYRYMDEKGRLRPGGPASPDYS